MERNLGILGFPCKINWLMNFFGSCNVARILKVDKGAISSLLLIIQIEVFLKPVLGPFFSEMRLYSFHVGSKKEVTEG